MYMKETFFISLRRGERREWIITRIITLRLCSSARTSFYYKLNYVRQENTQ